LSINAGALPIFLKISTTEKVLTWIGLIGIAVGVVSLVVSLYISMRTPELERHRRVRIYASNNVFILVLLALLWRFSIGPLLIRLPDDLSDSSVQSGRMTVLADRVNSGSFPPGETKILIENEDVSVPSQSDRRMLVVKERVTVRDKNTGQVLEGLREPTSYVLDRRTCENIPGIIHGINRVGYTIMLPMLSKKKAYQMWDDELRRTITANFVKTDRLDGDRSKGVEVYVYRINGDFEKMVKPPPGAPEFITGQEAKEMTGNPGLPVADSAETKIEYFKRTSATMYVEPKTGTVVNTASHRDAYYVKNAPGSSPTCMKIAEVAYSTDPTSVKRYIDDGARDRGRIDLDLKWVPIGLLGWATVWLALAVFLYHREKRRYSSDAGTGKSDS